MSSQLSETFSKQERAMRDAIAEIDEMQSKYMKTADRIIRDNQMIQQLQKQVTSMFVTTVMLKLKLGWKIALLSFH